MVLCILLFCAILQDQIPSPEYVIIEQHELKAIPDDVPRLKVKDFNGSFLECAYTPLYNDTRKLIDYYDLLESGRLQNFLNNIEINITMQQLNLTYTMQNGITIVSDQGAEYVATVNQLPSRQTLPNLSYKMAGNPSRKIEILHNDTRSKPTDECIINKEAIEDFVNTAFKDDAPDWTDDYNKKLYIKSKEYIEFNNNAVKPRLFYHRTETTDLFDNMILLYYRIANYVPHNSASLLRIQTLCEGNCIADSSKQAVANIHLTCLPEAKDYKLVSISMRHDMCGHDIVFGCDYVCNIKEIYEAVREAWNIQTVKCAYVTSDVD